MGGDIVREDKEREKFFKSVGNLDKLNRTTNIINVTEEDLNYIKKTFEVDVNDVRFPLTEGIVFVKGSEFDYQVYFEIHEEHFNIVYFPAMPNNEKVGFEYDFRLIDGEIVPKGIAANFMEDSKYKEYKEAFIENLTSNVGMVFSVLCYINNLSEVIEVKEEKTKIKGKNRHKSKNKNNKYTYITKKIYRLNPNKEDEKRAITRHVESWGVRGYWKVMKKSGKRVWVKPHIKGSGALKKTEYKVMQDFMQNT